jgi:hypothetical protein
VNVGWILLVVEDPAVVLELAVETVVVMTVDVEAADEAPDDDAPEDDAPEEAELADEVAVGVVKVEIIPLPFTGYN